MMRLLSLLVALSLTPPVAAQQDAGPGGDVEPIARAAESVRQRARSALDLEALAGAATAIERAQLLASQPPDQSQPGQLFVFVSAALGEQALKRAFWAASGDAEVTIVFRGALPGETLGQFTHRIGKLLQEIEPRPNVAINPKAFRDHDIETIPTIVEPATGKTLRGTFSPQTFRARAARGDEIDLGTLGPIQAVVEPDMALLLQQKMAEVDVEGRARDAVRTYWQRAPFVELPKVTTPRTRRLDPSIATANDLKDHGGKVIAAAGTRVNPLASLPLTSRILVFDGTDEAEIDWAKSKILANRRTILIATRIDRDQGWSAWPTLQQRLGRPVFLLPRHLAERLTVQATPTMIEASDDGMTLLVTEQLPPEITKEPDPS